jgi:hypothetical protein
MKKSVGGLDTTKSTTALTDKPGNQLSHEHEV